MKTLTVTLIDGTTVKYTVGASRNALGLSWDYTVTDTVLVIDQGDQQTTYPLASVSHWTVI